MLMKEKYIVAKYYNEIDAVISAVDNSAELDAGSHTVMKPFTYQITDSNGNTVDKQIDDFYKADITYDKTNQKITITEYMLNKFGAYEIIGTVELDVSTYNSIKSTL